MTRRLPCATASCSASCRPAPGDRHFALPGALLDDIQIGSLGPVDFHPQQLFQHSAVSELNVAVLVGADVSAPVSPGRAPRARRCDRARRDGGLPDGDGLRLPRDHRRARREREAARRRRAGGSRLRRVEHRRDVFRSVPRRRGRQGARERRGRLLRRRDGAGRAAAHRRAPQGRDLHRRCCVLRRHRVGRGRGGDRTHPPVRQVPLPSGRPGRLPRRGQAPAALQAASLVRRMQ